jgi:hypothetical protein
LDTVIALRRPEDYSPEQGARFEIHFEKLRHRLDGSGSLPFEARLEAVNAEGREALFWIPFNLMPRLLMQAAELFSGGMSVCEVAAVLRISKTEAGRLRLRALTDGILVLDDGTGTNEPGPTMQQLIGFSPKQNRQSSLHADSIPRCSGIGSVARYRNLAWRLG